MHAVDDNVAYGKYGNKTEQSRMNHKSYDYVLTYVYV